MSQPTRQQITALADAQALLARLDSTKDQKIMDAIQDAEILAGCLNSMPENVSVVVVLDRKIFQVKIADAVTYGDGSAAIAIHAGECVGFVAQNETEAADIAKEMGVETQLKQALDSQII